VTFTIHTMSNNVLGDAVDTGKKFYAVMNSITGERVATRRHRADAEHLCDDLNSAQPVKDDATDGGAA
jgi:hypothetical protein